MAKSNLLLYSLYYAEAFNEFAGPNFASLCLWVTQLLLKKYHSGNKLLATLCPIWPAWALNFRAPAPEINVLRLDQLAGKILSPRTS